MGVPLRQQAAIGLYIMRHKLRQTRRYPLVLMLEPLFRCNLACSGCGKIDYPDTILDQRISVDDALAAIDECGAPIVSIAGGEPLLHKEMPQIVEGYIERRKYVYLCTNALLLKKRLKDYRPSHYLTFSVHLDGIQERHDASVCQDGVYKRAVEAIKTARKAGFRVTVNCTLFQGESPQEVAQFMDECKALDVEGVTVAPGFSYERAPQQEVFLQRRKSCQLFREIFKLGKGKGWRFNHSSLYLDFLAGNQDYQCTAWGNPTRSIFGWQKPCYLLVGEGYSNSFKELIDEVDWQRWGVGRDPKCANCMVHCGFEPSAVNDAAANPLKAAWVALRGPRTSGPMVAEPQIQYCDEIPGRPTAVEIASPKDTAADGGGDGPDSNNRRVA